MEQITIQDVDQMVANGTITKRDADSAVNIMSIGYIAKIDDTGKISIYESNPDGGEDYECAFSIY